MDKQQLQPRRPVPWEGEFSPLGSPEPGAYNKADAIQPSVLCASCERIRLWMQDDYSMLSIRQWTTLPLRRIFQHLPSGRDLESSHRKGCHLCSLLWFSVTDYSRRNSSPATHEKYLNVLHLRPITVQCEFDRNRFILEVPRPQEEILSGASRPPTACLYLVSDESEGQASLVDKRRCKIDIHTDSICAQKASSCAVNTNSPNTLRLSQQWLQRCLAFHPKCAQRATQSPVLPTRLIDLTGSDLHLYETSSKVDTESYATLSYCWGGTNKTRLTLSSVQYFKDGFAVSSLPQTIQDAVHVTRSLGIKYLWIDALCIIQDCPLDWAKEVTCMSQVYRNSIVTIGALGAANSEVGLFSQRDPLSFQPCWMFRNAEGHNFYLAPATPLYWVAEAPLHRRGWVMQERILSPRTLNFGPHLLWECCQSIWHEFDLWESPLEDHWKYYFSLESLKYLFANINTGGNLSHALDESPLLNFWMDIVPQYTSSDLSVNTDRLAAVRGIIDFICHETGFRNYYGLWEPTLLQEALWRRSDRSNFRPRLSTVAPTWSWGSIEPQVYYTFPPKLAPKYTAKVKVTGGSNDALQVNTILMPLTLQYETIRATPPTIFASTPGNPFCGRDGEIADFEVFRDIHPIPGGPYFFAPLLVHQPRSIFDLADDIDGSVVQGLALAESANTSGAYERIGHVSTGILTSHLQGFLHRAETESVEIIIL